MTDQTKTPPAVQAATLSDFASKLANVDLTLADGEVRKFTVKIPSFHKYRELLDSVPDPEIPNTGYDGKKPVPNPHDPDYVDAKRAADVERTYRVVVWALIGGGMSIPGGTFEEQVRTFYNSEPESGLINALSRFLNVQASGVSAQARADIFRR
jgi:hypothetical protein